MSGYWEGSKSWCSATPTVRISANTSKPSNVQPRFEATSAFHCVRSSDRYQGDAAAVADWLMFSPCGFARLLLTRSLCRKAYAEIAWVQPPPREAGRGWPERSEGRVRGHKGLTCPSPGSRFRRSPPSPRKLRREGRPSARGEGASNAFKVSAARVRRTIRRCARDRRRGSP